MEDVTEQAIATQRARAWRDMARFESNLRRMRTRGNTERFEHWTTMRRAASAVWMRLSSPHLTSPAEIISALYDRARVASHPCEYDYIMAAHNAISSARPWNIAAPANPNAAWYAARYPGTHECAECRAVYGPGVAGCPSCGYAREQQ